MKENVSILRIKKQSNSLKKIVIDGKFIQNKIFYKIGRRYK